MKTREEKAKEFLEEMRKLMTEDDYFDDDILLEETALLKARAQQMLDEPKPWITRFLLRFRK